MNSQSSDKLNALTTLTNLLTLCYNTIKEDYYGTDQRGISKEKEGILPKQ